MMRSEQEKFDAIVAKYPIPQGMLTRRAGPPVRRGKELFTDGPYPTSWAQYVGQEAALVQLRAATASARARGKRLGHVLLASGLHGIGKSALARLIAFDLGAGMVTVAGAVTVDNARDALLALSDGDVLFIDEFHQLARTGGWLLNFLQDGMLRTGAGEEQMPDVTVIAATTDKQMLPETILSRFSLIPELAGYTQAQGDQIAATMATTMRLSPAPSTSDLAAIARAANNVPRTIGKVLEQYRDTAHVPGSNGRCDLGLALQWMGVTYDGLDRVAQAYLNAMLRAGGRASQTTVAALMGEPGPLRHTEKLLSSRAFVTIEKDGRHLTSAGYNRAVQLEVDVDTDD